MANILVKLGFVNLEKLAWCRPPYSHNYYCYYSTHYAILKSSMDVGLENGDQVEELPQPVEDIQQPAEEDHPEKLQYQTAQLQLLMMQQLSQMQQQAAEQAEQLHQYDRTHAELVSSVLEKSQAPTPPKEWRCPRELDKPRPFDPTKESWEVFEDRYNRYIQQSHMPTDRQITFLLSCLSSAAYNSLFEAGLLACPTLSMVMPFLQANYADKRRRADYEAEFLAIKRRPAESLRAFSLRMRHLMSKAKLQLTETSLVSRFLNTLPSAPWIDIILVDAEDNPAWTLDKVVERAERFELLQGDQRKVRPTVAAVCIPEPQAESLTATPAVVAAVAAQAAPNELDKRMTALEKLIRSFTEDFRVEAAMTKKGDAPVHPKLLWAQQANAPPTRSATFHVLLSRRVFELSFSVPISREQAHFSGLKLIPLGV